MNRNTELKALSCLLIIIALGLFSAAWFYEGIINKVGFTLFGVYVLWIVFKKPRTDNEQTTKNNEPRMVTCPCCGYVNVVESGHEEGIRYIRKCGSCNQMYGYRFELLVASFEIEEEDVTKVDGLNHRADDKSLAQTSLSRAGEVEQKHPDESWCMDKMMHEKR